MGWGNSPLRSRKIDKASQISTVFYKSNKLIKAILDDMLVWNLSWIRYEPMEIPSAANWVNKFALEEMKTVVRDWKEFFKIDKSWFLKIQMEKGLSLSKAEKETFV